MPFRHTDFQTENFYHIYNRGNNKEPIFFEPDNYWFFLQKFSKYFPQEKAELHAYCLVPNHYHLLLRIATEFDFSLGMQHFGISYAKSINKAYHRSGHLFQGRFGVKHVDSEEYLLHLSRYIHINPVRANLVKYPEEWQYSSYREYLNATPKDTQNLSQDISATIPGISPSKSASNRRISIRTEAVLGSFQCVARYKAFVESYLEETMKEMEAEIWN